MPKTFDIVMIQDIAMKYYLYGENRCWIRERSKKIVVFDHRGGVQWKPHPYCKMYFL